VKTVDEKRLGSHAPDADPLDADPIFKFYVCTVVVLVSVMLLGSIWVILSHNY
jgi:hypothetical protein